MLRDTVKRLLPQPVKRAARRVLGRASGNFSGHESWQEAKRIAGKYDIPFDYIAKRIDAIRSGATPNITLASQLAAVLLPEPPVRVLDFGGSLGHSYFHVMPFAGDRVSSWDIVEQVEVAQHGGHLFKNQSRLHFHCSIRDAISDGDPDVVICSGTLQYLDDPYSAIRQLFALGAQCVVLDRVPMESTERFFVQTAAGTRTAFRILSESLLFEPAKGYELIDKLLAPREGPTENYFCLLFGKSGALKLRHQ